MRNRIIYTVAMVAVLIITMIGIIAYMFQHTEKEAMERLRLEASKIKENINIQMNSDLETLRAMASLVAERYTDESSYKHICENFEAFGFCENIGILTPDNRLITKVGAIDVADKMSFDEEKAKGEYVSGRTYDVTNDERRIVRSAVPIVTLQGETMAIMYGTIDTERFAERYAKQTQENGEYICILEGNNGQFIIDTKNERLGQIATLSSIKYKPGYSYDKLVADISRGQSGYTAFIGQGLDEYLYIRYSSLNIADWRIMLAQPESVVFAGTRETIKFLIFTSSIILLIMILYILGILGSIRKMLKISSTAADIRKSLLEINQRSESLEDALRYLVEFADSRSAFITDSYNEEHHFIRQSFVADKLSAQEIDQFNKKLILYAARHRQNHGATVYISEIRCDDTLRHEMAEFYDFMKEHNIECVHYGVVINNNSNIYVLGILNAKNKDISELLKKVAVCFSMSVYNARHLQRTEAMALTDSLTGIANRMAYKQDIRYMNFSDSDIACIYVDVNELHFYNNKYGHAAGDQMLVFIARTLSDAFRDSYIYRMGGDEFLILCRDIEIHDINARIEKATEEIEEMKYHIAVGVTYGRMKTTLEDMVNEAEKIMYDKKSRYYQDKQLSKVTSFTNAGTVAFETGIAPLDACLSVMSMRYLAVYSVSLEKDKYVRILAPSYFKDMMDEANLFSSSMKRYFYELVKPEYHRALLSFIDYEALKNSLKAGDIPSASYERIDGQRVTLRIHAVDDSDDTIWVFEKEDE